MSAEVQESSGKKRGKGKQKKMTVRVDFTPMVDMNMLLITFFMLCITTNDITGGNSGSPVINGEGQLIGTAFDGNWESLSGDINFNNDLQRCIALDIRYVLFILDKLGNCSHLIKEMNIIE